MSQLNFRRPASSSVCWPYRRLVTLGVVAVLAAAMILQTSRPRPADPVNDLTALDVPGVAFSPDGSRPPAGFMLARAEGAQLPEEAVEESELPVETPQEATEALEPEADPFDEPLLSASDKTPPPLDEADIPFLLATVTDQDRDLPPALYYYYLDKARQQTPDQLRAQARTDVGFAHLYKEPSRDPARYRGELLTITGTARRIEGIALGPNAYGMTHAYEFWIFTDEGIPTGRFPWVAITTDKPAALALGPDVHERVTVTGYFLKLWAYRAGDHYRTAPVILGRFVEWHQAPALGDDAGLRPYLVGFVGLFAVLIIGMTIWFILGDRKFYKSRASQLANPSEGLDFEQLGRTAELGDDDEHAPWRASLRPDHELETESDLEPQPDDDPKPEGPRP